MQGKVHVAIGTASLAIVCLKYPTGFTLGDMQILPWVSLVLSAAGSYAPDIDMQTTHTGRQHATASKVINKFGGGHRGITHTLLVPLIIFAIMIGLNNVLSQYKYVAMVVLSPLFGFLYGYLMHIFADLFNGKGCPILWPISRSKVSVMDLPSSGIVPWIFAVVITAVQVLCVIGGVV